MSGDVLITGGLVADPGSERIAHLDLLIEGGKIARIGAPGAIAAPGANVHDATDRLVLPGLVNAQGRFDGFGAPITLAPAVAPLDLKVGDLDGNGVQDVVVAETNGVEVIYGQKPTTSASTQPSIRPLDDSEPPAIDLVP